MPRGSGGAGESDKDGGRERRGKLQSTITVQDGFAERTGESESNLVWKRKGKAIEFRSLSAADFEV